MSDLISKMLYDRYATTQALANGQDISDIMKYSHSYFVRHYGEILPSNRNIRILDMGCGYGRYLKSLMSMGYHNCYGIDVSEEQISYARNVLGLKNVEEADAGRWMKDKESSFNVVLAMDVLEHLESSNLVDLCKKVEKSLDWGGRFIVQVPNGLTLLNPIIHGDLTHVRAFTVESLGQLFRIAGFNPPVEYYEIPPHSVNRMGMMKEFLWSVLFRPVINLFVVVTYRRMCPAIYTNNFIGVAHKAKRMG